ncbi:K02A2.6-like [Cordylochernes scorpioides]|uniref:K02A2.6-like n=1 Tax=Cordylochernes scorpioides TaxID=51811 RepID=A0ABY6KXF9_9ARAC|nr:K02A2.6-like [Cordylochernes scorpioides]
METVLQGIPLETCLVYLDDIIVMGKSFEEHLINLERVPQKIRGARLKLNPKSANSSKRKFGTWAIPNRDCSAMACTKGCTPIEKFSRLEICSGVSNIARPLHRLTESGRPFSWTVDCERAMDKLKQALSPPPILVYPDPGEQFILDKDASNTGIGAVLFQTQDGVERVIAYFSKTLSKPEKNYCVTRRELLAIVKSIEHFRHYLYGQKIAIDIMGQLPRSDKGNRYILVAMDYFTKWPEAFPLADQEAETVAETLISQFFSRFGVPMQIHTDQGRNFESRLFAQMCKLLGSHKTRTTPLHPQSDGMVEKFNRTLASQLSLFVAQSQRDWDSSDEFVDRLHSRLEKVHRWAREKLKIASEAMKVRYDTQACGNDLQEGRFPVTNQGNKWIIVCTEYMTRFATTKAIPDAGAMEIAKLIVEEIILRHGAPQQIITDRRTNFMSQIIKEINNLNGISHLKTTAYHPQTNGLTERLNKTLTDMLSMYVDVEQKIWDEVLPFVTFAYNTAKKETTGFSPFFLVHGREAETTLDSLLPYHDNDNVGDYVQHLITTAEETRHLAQLHLYRGQEKDRVYYDRKHRPVDYNVGDLVWLFIPVRKVGLSEKLIKKYFGPYRITRKLSPVNYEIEAISDSPKHRKIRDTVHVLRMKPYLDPLLQEEISDSTPNEELVLKQRFSKDSQIGQ